ncbi:aldehyde dehydrogenase DhaS [Phytohabitans flavus]|uniref:Putative aldehyde dehydrogenase DhaS n=1 Tax=Phytohabitans flavus TaxID=1076124 RepID=A0A6F8XS00_9ACTN|nr:aldehyde dehydrogenase family protein [Phytohabitans flavus]BCB76600.1 putative aldehyde dehydrogenase DhaS [Phytohabitans flavus]
MDIRTRLLIGGRWLESGSGGEFKTYDPATNEVIGVCPEAGQAEVDEAVAAARSALSDPEWRDMSPAARGKLLWRIADLIDKHGDELGEIESRDQGQPWFVARHVNVGGTAEHFRYFAGWCTKIEGSTSPLSWPNVMNYTRREPVGVCALITPWNFPIMIAAFKLAPALACGNTAILKPAEQTPLSTYKLAEICQEAGVPAGVVNLLTGGPEVGKALVAHDGVDKVSFTGSTEVGRHIAAAAAGNLKRVTLELGGKAPSIIARDANIDAAVAGNLQGAFFNSGQVCGALTRFYVDEKRADEFAEKFAAGAKAMRLGRGLDEGTDLGPLVSPEQLESVSDYVRGAVSEGAQVLAGGDRAGGDLARGNFYEPTVLTNLNDEMTIIKEEVFGPVIPVLTYSDPDELAARANATQYGLVAGIWTRDLVTAHTLAAQIQAANVYINHPPVLDPAAPWGGYKASGYGQEMGRYAIDTYSEVKSIWVNLAA